MINVRIQAPEAQQLSPKITVVGVGGAGGNAVNNMISSNLEGCEFLACNTDAQALEGSLSDSKIQLGVHVTNGLGSGAKPEIGHQAAQESLDEVMQFLEGSNMAFVTAGMGGGTGTGAAPVIAKACRDAGILTVGVVTKPFHFEGTHRMEMAEAGIQEMQGYVDTLIVIPNQNLFRVANEKTTFADAFKMADSVLQSGVRGVTDLMVMPGLINLDFADIRSAMLEMGKAMMGTGEATGEDRAIQAAEKAIANPLLDEISLKGAKGVLINITGAEDLTLFELDEAANRIREEVDADANIIVGSTLDATMEGAMRVSVVATGIDANANVHDTPIQRRKLSEPLAQQPAAPAEEPVVAPVAAPAVAATAAPAAETDEPLLFEDMPPATDDGLPPPAYQPQVAQEPTPAPAAMQQPAAAAPVGRPAPGTPSPEALARLERVTGRAPGSMSGHVPGEARATSPASQATSAPAPVQEERPRFGINNLINRMSGAPGADRQAQPTRQQPSVSTPASQQQAPEEQERIEIPAFLRRQAN